MKIKGIEVANGELISDHYLAMDPGTVIEKIDGIETTEPVFGLPAVWITEMRRERMLNIMDTLLSILQLLWRHT